MKAPTTVTVPESGLVITISCAPTGPPGVRPVNVVAVTERGNSGRPAMVTSARRSKPVPEIVTGVPPVGLPVAGEILVKVGGTMV